MHSIRVTIEPLLDAGALASYLEAAGESWRLKCRELIIRALEIGTPSLDGDWLAKAETLADRLLNEPFTVEPFTTSGSGVGDDPTRDA
jgi:hypothetical protein